MPKAVPPSDQMRASGSGRRKVALPPGRSQLDWVRNSAKLRSPHPRTIPVRELRQHAKRHDAWIAISGKVFDVTPYIEYHPGGVDMILAGAGKDGTKLFNKYHAWVNPDFMLSRCFLGMLDVRDDELQTESDSESEEVPDAELSSDKALSSTPTNGPSDSASSSKAEKNQKKQSQKDIEEDLDALRVADLQE